MCVLSAHGSSDTYYGGMAGDAPVADGEWNGRNEEDWT